VTGYAENTLVRGLTFLAEKQAAIANNLANVDTTSFKRRAAIAQDTGNRFHSLLDRELSAVDYVEQSDMQRGSLKETGNRFDVAIAGDQWLRVQNGTGRSFYTRNGQLQIATDGHLTTRDGLRVLNKDGLPTQRGAGAAAPTDLAFSPNGTISDPSSGQQWGPLAMVELDDPHALIPIGKSLYVDPTNQQGKQAADGLQQGYLEGSNVDSLQELVAMITVERGFSATQRALTGVNKLQENMISQMLR
jgi:flagellar basal-body rod protein FlgG